MLVCLSETTDINDTRDLWEEFFYRHTHTTTLVQRLSCIDVTMSASSSQKLNKLDANEIKCEVKK